MQSPLYKRHMSCAAVSRAVIYISGIGVLQLSKALMSYGTPSFSPLLSFCIRVHKLKVSFVLLRLQLLLVIADIFSFTQPSPFHRWLHVLLSLMLHLGMLGTVHAGLT